VGRHFRIDTVEPDWGLPTELRDRAEQMGLLQSGLPEVPGSDDHAPSQGEDHMPGPK
jgi:hypothetical protein